MQRQFFSMIAKINKAILPSFTKRHLDISKASKLQLLIFGWRLYITKRALG
nr:SsrA-binding protein [Aquimarina sp. I32.4]